MTRINLPMLPTWNDLTDSQRWHAGYCARRLEDFGRVAAWYPGRANHLRFNLPDPDAEHERLELWTLDSLLCALTHAEPKIAFRSLLQAQRYLTKLEAMGRSVGAWRDSYTAAQHRVEDMLPEAVRRAS